MKFLGILFILIGSLIVVGSTKQGIHQDKLGNQKTSFYEMLTQLCSIGIYVVVLGIIFIVI